MGSVADFEIVDHGIEHCQYFQGCSAVFTSYGECVTGCGDNFAEAVEDALESIAQRGDADDTDWNELDRRILAVVGEDVIDPSNGETSRRLPTSPSVSEMLEDDEWAEHREECEMYYYVSIRFNLK
jgi:hypothetical protein